jgi:hypothetical protein
MLEEAQQIIQELTPQAAEEAQGQAQQDRQEQLQVVQMEVVAQEFQILFLAHQ